MEMVFACVADSFVKHLHVQSAVWYKHRSSDEGEALTEEVKADQLQ